MYIMNDLHKDSEKKELFPKEKQIEILKKALKTAPNAETRKQVEQMIEKLISPKEND